MAHVFTVGTVGGINLKVKTLYTKRLQGGHMERHYMRTITFIHIGGRPPPTRVTTIKAGGRRQHGKPLRRREAATKAQDHKEGGMPPPKWEATVKAGGRHQHGRPW